MKKIIVLIFLLLAVGLIINGDISNKVGNNNMAQVAGAGSNWYPVVGYARDNVFLQNNKGVINVYAYLSTNVATATTITLATPTIMKDGVIFTATTSDFKISSAPVIRKGFLARLGEAVSNTQSINIKKGKNIYLVQWSIDSALLPTGSYKMTFSSYTTGSVTTPIQLNPLWSNSITITDNDYRTLHGKHYRLESQNGQVWSSTSTAPTIHFWAGRMQANFCGISEGMYQVVRNRLSVSLKGSQPNCVNIDLTKLEKEFVKYIKYGMSETLSADGKLKLNLQMRGVNASYTFVQYTPSTGFLTGINPQFPPRIYPCDFVGPLEPNAIRDCGLGLGVSTGNSALGPILSYLNPITVTRGNTVTITGLNFASSTDVYLVNVANGVSSRVATVTMSPSATSFAFVVPTQYPCPLVTTGGSCSSPAAVQAGIYSLKVKTLYGESSTGLTVIIQ